MLEFEIMFNLTSSVFSWTILLKNELDTFTILYWIAILSEGIELMTKLKKMIKDTDSTFSNFILDSCSAVLHTRFVYGLWIQNTILMTPWMFLYKIGILVFGLN